MMPVLWLLGLVISGYSGFTPHLAAGTHIGPWDKIESGVRGRPEVRAWDNARGWEQEADRLQYPARKLPHCKLGTLEQRLHP